jgi:hypothetical protein
MRTFSADEDRTLALIEFAEGDPEVRDALPLNVF